MWKEKHSASHAQVPKTVEVFASAMCHICWQYQQKEKEQVVEENAPIDWKKRSMVIV